jgi:hypothetical protein
LREFCTEEIELLNQIPNVEEFLPIEDVNLLRQSLQ